MLVLILLVFYIPRIIIIASVWDRVSKFCQDLVRQLLVKDQKDRLSSKNAISHQWLKTSTKELNDRQKNQEIADSLRSLKNFKAKCVLQKAALTYIATQLLDSKQEQEIRAKFNELDTNKDGQVEESELRKGYSKVYKKAGRAKRISIEALKKADLNNNGVIDYTEFLVAHLSNHNDILTEKNLLQAFNYYDEVILY